MHYLVPDVSKKAFRFFAFAFALLFLTCSQADGDRSTSRFANKAMTDSEVRNSNGGGPPSLLLVTIDTWRWDYLGVSGSGKVETPSLDALAGEGLYVKEIVSPCPLTTPAHASLFTGLNPPSHGVLDCIHYTLSDRYETLAEAFRKNGYRTAAIVSGESVKARYGLNRGFDHYDDGFIEKRRQDDWLAGKRDGASTTDAALGYLKAAEGDAPVFLWVHYFDPHRPYPPRPRFDGKYPADPYASQVAFVDGQIGRLLKALRESGRPWRIVVTGDHGEGLGDHGEAGHGLGLYGSTLHVPLIVYPKPEQPVRHEEPFGLIDLAPTLKDWFDLQGLGSVEGESAFATGTENRPLPCLSLLPTFQYQVNPNHGIRRGRYMYMKHGAEELYGLSIDPGQNHDLARDPAHLERLAELRGICDSLLKFDESRLTPTLRSSLEELEALRGLGYIGGTVETLQGLQRADLRPLIREVSDIENVQEQCFQSRDYTAQVDPYKRFLKKYPRAYEMHKNLGLLLLSLGRLEEAADAYTDALRIRPDDPESLAYLGTINLDLGRKDRARMLLEAALQLDESHPFAHKSLAFVYSEDPATGGEAIRHFERHLELSPDDPEAARIRQWIEWAEAHLAGG